MSQPTNGERRESGTARAQEPQNGGYQQPGQSLGQGYDWHSTTSTAPDTPRDESARVAPDDTQTVSTAYSEQGTAPSDGPGTDYAARPGDSGGPQSQPQEYGRQWYAEQPGYGQQQPFAQPGEYAQPQDYGGQAYGQPQQNGFGQQADSPAGGRYSQFTAEAGNVASGAREGLRDLFGDLHFKKSLTERLASLVFLGVIVWAVLRFLSNLFYNFGSDSYGPGESVRHMGNGSAIVHSVTDLVWLVLVVGVIRILLEVAINVARLARKRGSEGA